LMGATGLAQNFAALRALVSDGIQKGHMRLHARTVAASAGVADDIFDSVVSGMIKSGNVKTWKARELAENLRTNSIDAAAPRAKNSARGEAAGKVIILGEHAVVYDRHAIALPIANAVAATVQEGPPGVRLSIPDWGIAQKWSADEENLTGAGAVVALIITEFGVAGHGLDIQISARIPIGMGLGSSAAFAVALIRAFNVFFNKGKSESDVDQLAFLCEGVTHGTPSGIDNNIATFGKPVLFNKGYAAGGNVLDLDEVPPLLIALGSERGNTKDMVAGVRSRHDRNQSLYQSIFDEIDKVSVAGSAALEKRDYAQLGALMNVCQGFLNAIEVSTPQLEQMIGIARDAGAIGAKLTGAGGGGSVVALCPDTASEVAGALEAAGYQTISLRDH
jgi:hydroxymethylglutaryl-CoA reductase